ncbi:ribonuclease [Paraurantiacibacter namhicola]|uniref:Ribonuclease E/G family protein n=1 Tax=Paraurantiacibacter namhicola TaxID=645517 RepID=A0A1C7D7H8_9SPHN|nr:ribonuclease [Paraurantiacibacter namhicola]ANU07436.1 Ribonuclease E/G family protein [Paraurantiacibacter namhicola]
MAEWLVEEGIGEHRAALFDGDEILAARLQWPGSLAAGQVEDALLLSRQSGSARGTLRFASGEEALVSSLPRDASEGSQLRAEILRPAMAERGRHKLAQARPTDAPPRLAPSLLESLLAEGQQARIVQRFPGREWEELWGEAWSGEIAFAGGSLAFFDTPAMTLVDVDGDLLPAQLAMAAVPPLARAIRRFDLGGSIGVDFPTLEQKAQRREVDAALGRALEGWPHERTAMNGFGFVQLVARKQRAGLMARIAHSRPSAAARFLLRQAEGLQGAGAVQLSCHPAVKSRLKPEWLEELARRTGREVRIEAAPTLALDAGHAQLVPR